MSKYLIAFCMLLSSYTFSQTAPAENLKPYSVQKSTATQDDKWPMYLQLEGKTGNFRDLARLTWMWPLWQDESSMLFADIRLMLDNQKDREGNFGLAYRKICKNISSDGLILGAYAFYDRKRSPFKNWFNQGTFGIEALGNLFQVRGNYYKPQNKSFAVGTSYSLSNPQTGWSSHGKNLVVTYDTVINTHTHKEQALKGYDALAALILKKSKLSKTILAPINHLLMDGKYKLISKIRLVLNTLNQVLRLIEESGGSYL